MSVSEIKDAVMQFRATFLNQLAVVDPIVRNAAMVAFEGSYHFSGLSSLMIAPQPPSGGEPSAPTLTIAPSPVVAPLPVVTPLPVIENYIQIPFCAFSGQDYAAKFASDDAAKLYAKNNGYRAFWHSNRPGSDSLYYFRREIGHLDCRSKPDNKGHKKWSAWVEVASYYRRISNMA